MTKHSLSIVVVHLNTTSLAVRCVADNGSVVWSGDGTSVDLWRRERPHMVVDKTGTPLAISNGIQECRDSGPCPTRNDRSWTLVQAVAQRSSPADGSH
eukprot:SAG11_NODE_1944_length_4019_cov_2.495792_4_plen_98_part_00